MRDCWAGLQTKVAGCSRCSVDLPSIGVENPPGQLYPPGIDPPKAIRVLFVGVAPPRTGRHFYTDPSDNLRRGLFNVLAELGGPCRTVDGFVKHGFFLVHTAKCVIRGTTKPNLEVSKLCASIHLAKEIECLSPDGICFLSKNVAFPVFLDLLPRWRVGGAVNFGEVTTLAVNEKPIQSIATAWPGRGHEALTKVHLRSLFCELSLPVWN